MESQEQPNSPPLCACGFYGNPATNNLCSKCYREEQARTQAAQAALAASTPAPVAAAPAAAEAPAAQQPPPPPQQQQQPLPAASPVAVPAAAQPAPADLAASPAAAAVGSSGAAASPAADATPEPSGKVSTRCQQCRKKVGLTGFKCKCGQLFCGQHRYAESHGCTFDYKSAEREKLAQANPLVQASKVERI